MEDHPGGCDCLFPVLGRDCTAEFQAAGHSASAMRWARRYATGLADAPKSVPKDLISNTHWLDGLTVVASKFSEFQEEGQLLPVCFAALSVASAFMAVRWAVF